MTLAPACGRGAVGAVLLAAGGATRMGGRPKCLLELDGVPLVRRLVDALKEAGIGDLVVVTGHHAEAVEPVLQGLAVTRVRNPDPDAGQTSSQRLGLQALTGPLDAVIVALADQPLLDHGDIEALLDAWRRRAPGIEVVHPEVDGQRGNPVILSAAVRAQVLAAGPEFGGREWQQAHHGATAAFRTANPHFRLDLDTPEDLRRFEALTGRTLRWPAGTA